jgi:hypothetical protein
MLKLALVAVAALPLAACATTPPTESELAYCQQMERTMGTDHQHDHAQAKGQGLDPMNVTHARCRDMLGMS